MSGLFKKAVKSQSRLRLALYGPSGAGKTFTSLAIASGMGEKIALIDTERGSASKYADLFGFDVCELQDKSIDSYVAAIRGAGSAGYDVLVVDSLSHAWAELLEEINRLTKSKFKGNSWSAWSDGSPKQKQLVDSILGCDSHVIATMRSKTEWSQDNSGGKARPVKIGLSPEQGKGIEYEFDMLASITPEHIMYVEKDRTAKFQDKTIEKPGAEFGKDLVAWLNTGEAALIKESSPRPDSPTGDAMEELRSLVESASSAMLITNEQAEKLLSAPTLSDALKGIKWLNNKMNSKQS